LSPLHERTKKEEASLSMDFRSLETGMPIQFTSKWTSSVDLKQFEQAVAILIKACGSIAQDICTLMRKSMRNGKIIDHSLQFRALSRPNLVWILVQIALAILKDPTIAADCTVQFQLIKKQTRLIGSHLVYLYKHSVCRVPKSPL